VPEFSEMEADLHIEALGAAGAEALRIVGETLEQMRGNVAKNVLKEIDKPGGLLPNVAVQAWMQLYGIEKLHARLNKVIRSGAKAAERVAPTRRLH